MPPRLTADDFEPDALVLFDAAAGGRARERALAATTPAAAKLAGERTMAFLEGRPGVAARAVSRR